MSLRDQLEHLVCERQISPISQRIDGNKEAVLYQDDKTLNFILLCCDTITFGGRRVCGICHVYAPIPEEMVVMEERRKYYQKLYPQELGRLEMREALHRYVRSKCDGVLLYSTFLDHVREWDACYPKYCVMEWREFLRRSVYLASREMGWLGEFTLFEREEFDKLSEAEKKAKLSADGGGVNGIIMKCKKKK